VLINSSNTEFQNHLNIPIIIFKKIVMIAKQSLHISKIVLTPNNAIKIIPTVIIVLQRNFKIHQKKLEVFQNKKIHVSLYFFQVITKAQINIVNNKNFK